MNENELAINNKYITFIRFTFYHFKKLLKERYNLLDFLYYKKCFLC